MSSETQYSQQVRQGIFQKIYSAYFSLKDESTIWISDFAFRLSIVWILLWICTKLFFAGLSAIEPSSYSIMLSIMRVVAVWIYIVYFWLIVIFSFLFYKRWLDGWFRPRTIEYCIIALVGFYFLHILQNFSWFYFLHRVSTIVSLWELILTIVMSVIILFPTKAWVSRQREEDSLILKWVKLAAFAVVLYWMKTIITGFYFLSGFWLWLRHIFSSVVGIKLWLQFIIVWAIVLIAIYKTLKKEKNIAPVWVIKPMWEIDPQIQEVIDSVDISRISCIRFTEAWGRTYNIMLDSIKRIAVIIYNKTWKSVFMPNELTPDKEIIFKYFYSQLPFDQVKMLEQYLMVWIEKGGSFEILKN